MPSLKCQVKALQSDLSFKEVVFPRNCGQNNIAMYVVIQGCNTFPWVKTPWANGQSLYSIAQLGVKSENQKRILKEHSRRSQC